MSKIKSALLVTCCTALLLTGCREVLFSNLTESDANEVISVLLKRNIDAVKVNAGKEGFSIEVEQSDFINALEIAKENSLPKAKFESLGSVFSGQGMISSQTEEQSRLAYALSQELADTLMRIDGVLDARVHVVLVQHDQMSGITTQPSASVFIKHQTDSPVTSMVVSIKETVAKAVPGLDINSVSVMLESYSPNVYTPAVKKGINFVNIALGALSGLIVILALVAALMWKRGYRFNLYKTQKDKTQSPGDDVDSNNEEKA